MSRIEGHLRSILNCLQQKDGDRLKQFFVLDLDNVPSNSRQVFEQLHQELNNNYPASRDAALSTKVKQFMPTEELQNFHALFTDGVVQYLRYLRDYLSNDNLAKAESTERLVKQCIGTLDKEPYGAVMIPLVLSFVNVLRYIAINLDRNPALISEGKVKTSSEGDEGRITFVENTANIVREAFNKCLLHSKPDQPPNAESATSGIYSTIASSMKLYDRVGKLGNLTFLLRALDQKSPPLSYYPAAQRVTFLYYLGRFHFANNHFYRATQTLQAAYEQCHRDAIKHRKAILIHLIASNMCLGRLPGNILILDQAAHDISKPFIQLSQIIKSGDIGAFHTFLDYTNPHNTEAQWFLNKRVLLQLRNRCEVLVWRTLIYRTMEYAGSHNSEKGVMPFVRYESIVEAAQYSFFRARQRILQQTNGTAHHNNPNYPGYRDPDLDGVEDTDGSESESGSHHSWNEDVTDTNPDLPTAEAINTIVLSLISQGFMAGFVQHTGDPTFARSRFLIPVKSRLSTGATDSQQRWKRIGFPSIWGIIREREWENDEGMVPGWVTQEKVNRILEERRRPRVVHLQNARAAGS